MKAAVCREFGKPLSIEEVELAEPGQGEVAVRIRACAICHSDFDNNGVPLERTYKEWFQGPYAKEGVVCVDCHMAPTRPGDGRVSHRFPGGHSDSPLLPGAATVEVAKASPAEVLLQVYNARVGHHFPTAGAHPNALYLDVRFLDAGGAVLASHRRRYAFVYLDEQGNEVEGTATAVGTRDTTLGPRERRDERFPVPDNARSVEAVLTYVPLPAHMGDRVGEALYRRAYAPVEIHRARQAL